MTVSASFLASISIRSVRSSRACSMEEEIIVSVHAGAIVVPECQPRVHLLVPMDARAGSAPQGLILCHQPTRKTLRHFDNFPILPLPDLIDLYEKLACPVHPCKVLGISLNCVDLPEDKAREEIRKVERETKLPVTDPIKFGVEKFINVIQPLLP